jgi:hypothetical protein
MDGRFVTAFVIPRKWKILGYELGPFTLRHYLAMLALESPLLKDDIKDCRAQDIVIFLRVCSMDNAFVALEKPSWKDKWRHARLDYNMTTLVQTVLEIRQYVLTAMSSPKTYAKEDKNEIKKDTIPGILGIATSLMARLNMPPEEAWKLTPGQAIWYLTSYAISEGADIKILTTQAEANADAEREFLIQKQKEALSAIKERMKGMQR